MHLFKKKSTERELKKSKSKATPQILNDCLVVIEKVDAIFQLADLKDEELTEFNITINLLRSSVKIALQSGKDTDFADVLVKDLLTTLNEFESELNNRSKSGQLQRTFSLFRLRPSFEKTIVHLEVLRQETFKSLLHSYNVAFIGNGNSSNNNNTITTPEGLSTNFQDLIADKDGKHFWKMAFGSMVKNSLWYSQMKHFWVPWNTFVQKLEKFLDSSFSYQLEKTDTQVLKYLLDSGNTDYVSAWKFGEFLKTFGPVRSNPIQVMKFILREKWFYGFLTKMECDNLLSGSSPGTYLVRFGSKSIGMVYIAFSGKDKIYHIPVKPTSPGFSVYESESQSTRTFNSLHEVINMYSYALTNPYASSLPFERFHAKSMQLTRIRYFQGELNSSEAATLLKGTSEGTFMARFSSTIPGAFVISFVEASTNSAKHVLVKREDEYWQINMSEVGGNAPTGIQYFASIQELIAHMSKVDKILLHPVGNLYSMDEVVSIISKWKNEVIEIEFIIDSIWKPFMHDQM